ncbi:MAG: N-6 DNA methylase [Gammaproteobacteria bacterium]|nr:N-6 DNA methylase [Gammaproteobacteria bacterium]
MHLDQLLTGYVELKAPGVGATSSRFTGHNRDQFKRFAAIPNILYTDGNEWALYRGGGLVGRVVCLAGDVATKGSKASTPNDALAVERLLRDFLSWQPFIPTDRKGKIDLKRFAAMLAPLSGLLRDDVTDALKDPISPLVQLAKDWRQLLFPDAGDDQFADAYAQTVTFALLLGRSEDAANTADTFSLESAETALAVQHNLLARTLQVLTDPAAHADIAASLDLLLRVIKAVPPTALTAAPDDDPWLYFYEDFLAAYDPKLRKDAGVYYTPVEVVRAQVRLIDDLLVHRLNKPLGFADPGVVTLDPAVGTGTYLLGVIEHALGRVEAKQGFGAVAGQATTLAGNLYGFELMVGAYSVAELRVSRALRDRGAQLPADGTHVYLTDSLESPHAETPQLALFLRPIADQHARALQVKSAVPVIVCLGNPPYDRHEAASDDNKASTGGWVRWGEDGEEAIFKEFLDPVVAAGNSNQLKNIYNQYVYFWRWAMWKVFEHDTARGPGVISFISASSYLDGDAFGGMREHLRRQCDDIWILDLGGERRGTRKSDNVFAIQTPVAIAVAVREKHAKEDTPSTVRYARIEGTREEKLSALDAVSSISTVTWHDCPTDWQSPFRPAGRGVYFDWPLLTDLMPWQQSGVKAGRTWVISPEQETLRARWQALLEADTQERQELFKDSPSGRKVKDAVTQLPPSDVQLPPVTSLAKGDPAPEIARFSFRSLDRQYILYDARMLDRPGPSLWQLHDERQVYVTSLLTTSPLGGGSALMACATIPDLHHFRGSYGAKDTIPLYRAAEASQTNVLPGLLDILCSAYERAVSPEDFLAYVYGVLAQPAFTKRFAAELETREVRVPLTKDAALFEQVRAIGARLLWLHTYGERLVPEDNQRGHVPSGAARCVRAISGDAVGYPDSFMYVAATQTLHVGDGAFAPLKPEIFEFEVSGLKVLQSWLKYRMRKGAGRRSSPLDDIRPARWTSAFTTELLELLWVLEATVALYPEQEVLLEAVVESGWFQASDLPSVPEELRKTPPARSSVELFSLQG